MYRWVTILCAAAALSACDDDSSESSDPADRGIESDGGPILGDGAVQPDASAADSGLDEDAAIDTDAAVEEGLACDRQANFGLRDDPISAIAADTARYNPRVVWTGEIWGATWMGPADTNGHHTLYFGRFDASGAELGAATRLGETGSSQHVVTFTGTGFAVVWFNGRSAADPYDGLRIALLDAEGALAGPATNIPAEVDQGTTYDALHLAAAWAPLGRGMSLYTRGRQHGEEGLFAVAFDEAGAPSAPVMLTEGPVDSPSVVYGDGVWGAAWIERNEDETDVVFVLLNDQGVVVSTERRLDDAGAEGSTYLTFGRATYGLAWNKNFLGDLKPFITLFDSGGDILTAGSPLQGPEGFSVVTGAAFLPPDALGVSWQDTRPDGARVGMSRMDVQGRALAPFTLPSDGSSRLTPTVGGNLSRIGMWTTTDPAPAPGGYSDETFIEFTPLGPCN